MAIFREQSGIDINPLMFPLKYTRIFLARKEIPLQKASQELKFKAMTK